MRKRELKLKALREWAEQVLESHRLLYVSGDTWTVEDTLLEADLLSILDDYAGFKATLRLAMERMDFAIGDAYSARQDLTTQKGYTRAKAKEDCDMDHAALAVIRAALTATIKPPLTVAQTTKVTREWIRKCVRGWMDCSCPTSIEDLVIDIIREKGIEGEEFATSVNNAERFQKAEAQLAKQAPLVEAACAFTEDDKKRIGNAIDNIPYYTPISDYKCPGKVLRDKFKALLAVMPSKEKE